MANVKITDLTAYTDAASTDVMPIVDIANDVTKKISISNLLKAAPLGSAAAPGVAFDGDPNTGIYSPGADQVAISTGGSGRLFVDASGRVGVGVSSPQSLFHVDGDATAIRVTRGSAIGFAYNTGTAATDPFRIQSNGGAVDLLSAASQPITLSAGGSEKVRVTSAGLVGIGTTSPGSELEVKGSSSSSITIRAASGSNLSNILFARDGSGGDVRIRSDVGNNTLEFVTTGTERLRVDSSGRLLVGTNSIGSNAGSSVVAVKGSNVLLGTGQGQLAVITTDTQAANVGGSILLGGQSTQADWPYACVSGRSENNGYAGYFAVGTSNAAGAVFERARIDSSGRLLVGTSTASGDQLLVVQGYAGVSAGNAEFGLRRGGNPSAADQGLGAITFQNSSGNSGARIEAASAGSWTSGSNHRSYLTFSTTADGASSPTERMRITNDGLLLLGQTSSSTSTRFQVTGVSGQNVITCKKPDTGGMINFIVNGSTEVGYITTTGSSTSYVTSSDYRLKENVIAVNDGILRLQQLKPCRFNFIADPAKTVDGFLAHEAAEVVPECVTGTKDEVDDEGNPVYQGIDQSKLVPLLTAALQEAIGEIELLKARVAALESA